jgi:CubicO group peptidase (beta-lactamase class C family)
VTVLTRILTLAVLNVGVAIFAQDRSAPSTTSVAVAIERELKAARVPGATFAVVAGTESIAGSFGLADVERGVQMTPATLLQVGSLNKLMTALSLATTLESRKIPLDSPIGRHVPGLSSRLGSVTFHQLLSQTSGLRDQIGAGGTGDEAALGTRVRSINDRDFILPAGTVFSYSNLGYAAAGFALEHLRQKPFADAIREALFQPLGMHRTTMRVAEAEKQTHAIGHRLEGSSSVAIREIDSDSSLSPAGYLWTSAEEMQPLLRLLTMGATRELEWARSIVSRATTPQTPMPNVFVGGHYGYGLMLATDRGSRFYEHGGTQRGFSSILRVAPDHGVGLVILTNLDNAPLRRIAQTVMADALRLPADKPPARVDTVVTAAEMAAFTGVYSNRGTAEIALRDGRVVLILDGGPAMAVSRIGGHRYLARPKPDVAGPEFVLQPAAATAPAYLHFALWAYTR